MTSPSPAGREELIRRLRHALATAMNDDYSVAGTDKRARHVERLAVLSEAADFLEAADALSRPEPGVAVVPLLWQPTAFRTHNSNGKRDTPFVWAGQWLRLRWEVAQYDALGKFSLTGPGSDFIGNYDTLELAQARAQTEFVAVIQSALRPAREGADE